MRNIPLDPEHASAHDSRENIRVAGVPVDPHAPLGWFDGPPAVFRSVFEEEQRDEITHAELENPERDSGKQVVPPRARQQRAVQ